MGVCCQHRHTFAGYSSRGHSHPCRQKREGTKTNATSQRVFKSTPMGQAVLRRLSDLSRENIELEESTELIDVFYRCMLIVIEQPCISH